LTNPPILATRDLGLDIGGAKIVVDVSLEVAEGELLGIIGPNGAGKTSLFNLLSGIYRPTAGSIQFAGREITHQPVALRTREGLGRTFQVSSVFPLLTVHENVRLAAESAAGGTMRIWRRAPVLEAARAATARVGLERYALHRAGSLAHGDKRRLEIAMLLAADKPVLLLDEPMAGLSAEHVPRLVELIRTIHEQERKTVLMVEHHIDVVTGIAQRIAVMHHGALLAVDTPAAIMSNATVQSAYLGEAL
jgi:branched-chain amino acid transport system ATP-binding protein